MKDQKTKKEAIIINIIGGPGTGKSIIASDVFSALKRKYVSCDISAEYIKRKLREQALKVVQNQVYIFAKQQFQLFSMKDDVQVIVTDAPFILCPIYDKTNCPFLKGLSIKEFKKYRNLTYFIERDKKVVYEQEGRYQDLKGARAVDKKVKKFLIDNKIEYKSLNGIGVDSLEVIVNDIVKILDNDKRK